MTKEEMIKTTLLAMIHLYPSKAEEYKEELAIIFPDGLGDFMTDSSCIKNTLTENESWCGKILKQEHFYFKDAEHAAINSISAIKYSPCVSCVNSIIDHLRFKV